MAMELGAHRRGVPIATGRGIISTAKRWIRSQGNMADDTCVIWWPPTIFPHLTAQAAAP